MSWASSGSLQGIEQSGQHSGIVQASRLCLSSSALADTSAKVTGKEGHRAHNRYLLCECWSFDPCFLVITWYYRRRLAEEMVKDGCGWSKGGVCISRLISSSAS